jgi:hypothetical protein
MQLFIMPGKTTRTPKAKSKAKRIPRPRRFSRAVKIALIMRFETMERNRQRFIEAFEGFALPRTDIRHLSMRGYSLVAGSAANARLSYLAECLKHNAKVVPGPDNALIVVPLTRKDRKRFSAELDLAQHSRAQRQ